MIVAVSDTSPLRYLIAAAHSDLIARLFDTVLILGAVERELVDPHSPPSVQLWMRSHPAWLRVRHVQAPPDIEFADKLDAGEAEAIQLAMELRARVLIMDERRGREIATARGIAVVGALGILRESYRRGLIGNPLEVATQLRSMGFRASRALMRRFEEQIRELERQRVPKEKP